MAPNITTLLVKEVLELRSLPLAARPVLHALEHMIYSHETLLYLTRLYLMKHRDSRVKFTFRVCSSIDFLTTIVLATLSFLDSNFLSISLRWRKACHSLLE